MLGMLPEERLERSQQLADLQCAVSIDVPGRVVVERHLLRGVGEFARDHLPVDRVGEASRIPCEAGGVTVSQDTRSTFRPSEAGVLAHDQATLSASAGRPLQHHLARDTSGVHPRVCGEAVGGALRWTDDQGPSPRVRGSRRAHIPDVDIAGSIPACAGEASSSGAMRWATTVHPRVCGEALGGAHDKAAGTGPSPRVRGSP